METNRLLSIQCHNLKIWTTFQSYKCNEKKKQASFDGKARFNIRACCTLILVSYHYSVIIYLKSNILAHKIIEILLYHCIKQISMTSKSGVSPLNFHSHRFKLKCQIFCNLKVITAIIKNGRIFLGPNRPLCAEKSWQLKSLNFRVAYPWLKLDPVFKIRLQHRYMHVAYNIELHCMIALR